MFSFICMLICATLLWALAYFGIKNYEYDRSESMLSIKILSIILYLIIVLLECVKYFRLF